MTIFNYLKRVVCSISFVLLITVAVATTQDKSDTTYYKLAKYYDSIVECKKAIKAITKAISIKETPEYYLFRGKLREKCNGLSSPERSLVIHDYYKSFQLDPKYNLGRWALVEFDYKNLTTLPAIIMHCDYITGIDSSFYEAYALKGAVYLFKRDTLSATMEFNKALNYGNDSSAVFELIGGYYFQHGYYKNALEYYFKSLSLRKDKITFEGYENITLSYWFTNSKDSACYYLRACTKAFGEQWGTISDYCDRLPR